MLVLPIVNGGRVLNVEIRLKNVEKIRRGVRYDDAYPGDIIVNREKFSQSSFGKTRGESAAVDFIRSRSLKFPRSFLITTKEERDSTLYDVYKVPKVPKLVNKSLDKLYNKAIEDLRCEIPDKNYDNDFSGIRPKGRVVSFDELGLGEELSEEKLSRLERIVRNYEQSRWPEEFEKNGISSIPETLNFMENFECFIISNYDIPEKSFNDVIKLFSVINTREYRNLKKYYKTAKSNCDIFSRMSLASKILYNKPLKLYTKVEKPKIYMKTMDGVNEARA